MERIIKVLWPLPISSRTSLVLTINTQGNEHYNLKHSNWQHKHTENSLLCKNSRTVASVGACLLRLILQHMHEASILAMPQRTAAVLCGPAPTIYLIFYFIRFSFHHVIVCTCNVITICKNSLLWRSWRHHFLWDNYSFSDNHSLHWCWVVPFTQLLSAYSSLSNNDGSANTPAVSYVFYFPLILLSFPASLLLIALPHFLRGWPNAFWSTHFYKMS